MKKTIALFALSFVLVSASHAQTGTRSTDTTTSHKMMKKNMNKGKRGMDSSSRGNSSLYPMNNGTGRADSTNTGTGKGTITPNQNPGTTPGTTPTPNPNK